MPYYRLGQHMVHLKFGGKLAKNPPAPCCARIQAGERNERCMALSLFLCDHPVGRGTCDAPLCEEHVHQTAADRHLCPVHLAEHRAATPELF